MYSFILLMSPIRLSVYLCLSTSIYVSTEIFFHFFSFMKFGALILDVLFHKFLAAFTASVE